MKRIKTILAAISMIIAVIFTLAACSNDGGGSQSQEPPLDGDSNVLITYFSWSNSNNTQTMAGYIADATGGELFRLLPKTPYTTNYNEVLNVAQTEKNNNARPILADNLTSEQFESYDIIFIGYPIWWYDAPMIIYSFVESHDFTGKTIIPFATSGGSGLSGSDSRIATICEGATILDGLVLSGSNIRNLRSSVDEWISSLGINANE